MSKAETKTIARSNYYKLVGLLELARMHYRHLREIEKAAAEITGESGDDWEYWGHTSDAIWSGDTTPDELLSKLGIEIEDADD